MTKVEFEQSGVIGVGCIPSRCNRRSEAPAALGGTREYGIDPWKAIEDGLDVLGRRCRKR